MKTSLNKLPNSEAELIITLEGHDLSRFGDAAYENLKAHVTIAGFRPGNAPRFMVEQEVGEDRWNKELLEIAITLSFMDAVKEHELVTISAPEVALSKYVPGSELEYKARVALMPQITIPEYKKIKVEKGEANVSKGEIDAAIERLRKQAAEIEPKDGPAESGDRVEVDFEGILDGKPLDKGMSKNHPLVIGENMFVPGFEDNLIGMAKGEEREFTITFPAQYHERSLAGKPVTFKVKMNLVHKLNLPELSDSFVANSHLGVTTVEELTGKIAESLKLEKERKEGARIDGEILKKLVEGSKVELSDTLVASEAEKMLEDVEEDLGRQGVNLDQYLATVKKSLDELQGELRSQARERLTISLALTEIAKAESIDASPEEVDSEIIKMMSNVPEDKEKVEQQLRSEEGMRNIKNRLIAIKTQQKLREIALSKT